MTNFETPEADAAEQARLSREGIDEAPAESPIPDEVPADVNPADLAEQQIVVPDDEDYDR